MNLRIIPAHPTSPTVIFSLNWHNLPSSLPLPSFYAQHLSQCSDSGIPTPRNTLALDKAVGFHLLLESVTFDLARGFVVVAWLDKRSEEWPILSIEGLQKSLEDVLDCVRMSGEEAEKEKKAAQQAATAAKAGPHATATAASSSTPDLASTAAPQAHSSGAHKRHRTASGIFSSLVASFIAPPVMPELNAANAPATTNAVPAHLAHLPRRRSSKSNGSFVEIYHAQHIMHPSNKRESFATNGVPQSRFLRRQARAKLVDVFRFYVASRLTGAMRKSGIVGDELKDRGILDDMDDDETCEGPVPGTSGFQAAGGYVAFMARSMLRGALTEQEKAKAAAASSSSDDSFSSSSEESLLLTPTNGSDTSLPSSSSDGKVSPKPTAAIAAAAARRRAPTPTPQARQIRQLSSLLIGLTQKDKRTSSEEREMLELVKERSLRRRYSLAESSSLTSKTLRFRVGSLPADWNKPVVPSPLRATEVAQEEEQQVVEEVKKDEEMITVVLPFPTDVVSGGASADDDDASVVASVPRRTQSLPTPPPSSLDQAADAREDVLLASNPKAAEAEDAVTNNSNNAPSRQRRSAILTSQPTAPLSVTIVPTSPTQDAPDLIDHIASLPSPKYTEFPEVYASRRLGSTFPEDVDDSDEDDEEEVSPPPSYAPPLSEEEEDHRFASAKGEGGVVKGLGLVDAKNAAPYWAHHPNVCIA